MGSARWCPRKELGAVQTSIHPTVVPPPDMPLHPLHLAFCRFDRGFYHYRPTGIRSSGFRKTHTCPCPEERCIRLLDRDIHTWLGSLYYRTRREVHLLPALSVSHQRRDPQKCHASSRRSHFPGCTHSLDLHSVPVHPPDSLRLPHRILLHRP